MRAHAARHATLAILGVGYLATLVANLPGHLSYDSIVQLADGRAWRFHTWHPPAMAWLLGVGDHILPGSALFTAAQSALLFASLAAWVATRRSVSWLAPLVAAAMVASPLVLIYQGIVWKDVLFADATVAGFLILGLGARDGVGNAARIGGSATAFVLFGLAALVRQNGVGVPVFGAIALAWTIRRRDGRGSGRRALLTAAVALVVTVTVALATEAALMARRVDEPGPAAQMQTLQGYDVIGAVAHDAKLDLSALPPALAATVRRAARTVYSPERVDRLDDQPGLNDTLTAEAPAIAAQWRAILLHHPGAWLAHRWDVFRWTLAPPVLTRCVPVYVGVDGPPELMASLGLTHAPRPQDAALRRYAARFYTTPVFAHLAYGLVGAAAAAWLLLRRRRVDDIAVGVLQLAALSFAASFALIGIACDYRYLYALDLAAMVAVLHLALEAGTAPRRQTSGGAETRRRESST